MKLKPKEVLTGLDDLEVMSRLKRRYFDDWVNGDLDQWNKIAAKLGVLDDVKRELRSMINTEGMDNASKRT